MSTSGNVVAAPSSSTEEKGAEASASERSQSILTGAGDGPKSNDEKPKQGDQPSSPRKINPQEQPNQNQSSSPPRKFNQRQYSDQRFAPHHHQYQQHQHQQPHFIASWRKPNNQQPSFDRNAQQQGGRTHQQSDHGGFFFGVPNINQLQRAGNHGGGVRRGSSQSVNFQPHRENAQHQHQAQYRRTAQNQAQSVDKSNGANQEQHEGEGDRRRHSTGGRNRKKSEGAIAAKPTKPPSGNRYRSSQSENMENGSGDYENYSDFELEEPFSESDEEETEEEREARRKRQAKPLLLLPTPRRRIRTLSGMIPAVGFAPVWGGPTMCLNCLEFFDLPKQTSEYVQHLLEKHKIVVTDIELIVDLKRYIEHWRHRFGQDSIEKIFPLVTPKEDDPLHGKVDKYYLMSEKIPEDRQTRERLALRRLEEVLSCQQREREDRTFSRQCLFCRYRTRGNRAKLVHHLYTIHHLNLGSPDNLVFVSEYLDTLEGKLKRNECIYCEKVFPDHNTLTEHMRKKQHREVNPKNNFYDRFYVINYLELGKKWLEVLAEDFEDNTPHFLDSDEEEEEESWNEWEEDGEADNEITAVCLFCDEAFEVAPKLLDHMKETHQYDLKKVFADGQFGFYDRVKFINYIRKLSHGFVCFVCGTDDLRSWPALRKHLATADHLHTAIEKEKWDKDEYLIPIYDNDSLLCFLEEILELDEDEFGTFVDKPGSTSIDEPEKKSESKENVDEKQSENGVEKVVRQKRQSQSAAIVVIPEDLPYLEESALNDPELREQLK